MLTLHISKHTYFHTHIQHNNCVTGILIANIHHRNYGLMNLFIYTASADGNNFWNHYRKFYVIFAFLFIKIWHTKNAVGNYKCTTHINTNNNTCNQCIQIAPLNVQCHTLTKHINHNLSFHNLFILS